MLAHERHADFARPGLDRHADFEARVRGMHVDFPARVALRVAREALGCRQPLAVAADGESLEQRAIESQVDLVRLAHANQVEIKLPLQDDLDRVVAVEREVIPDGGAAARPEGLALVRAVVLYPRSRYLERVNDGVERGVADGEP